MRLLRTDTGPDEAPKLLPYDRKGRKYAILSHRACNSEVGFEHIQGETGRDRLESYSKIINAIRQAASDGHEYIWIDSCCIDQSSSAEHQEALNSMYTWYQKAQVCYAILADVPEASDENFETAFGKSDWFARGWTLQELLAPERMQFFGKSKAGAWVPLGSRKELSNLISRVTAIHPKYLTGQPKLHEASIAQRMSWAAKRETTREEDMAYALLGVFSVNMPMLYGEGKSRAFRRLQEEIMKISDDQSIFAWMEATAATGDERCEFEAIGKRKFWKEEQIWTSNTSGKTLSFRSFAEHGLLANSPSAFSQSDLIIPMRFPTKEQVPYQMTNRGLSINLKLTRVSKPPNSSVFVAELDCSFNDPDYGDEAEILPIGVYLLPTRSGPNQYARIRSDKLVTFPHDDAAGVPTDLFVRQPRT